MNFKRNTTQMTFSLSLLLALLVGCSQGKFRNHSHDRAKTLDVKPERETVADDPEAADSTRGEDVVPILADPDVQDDGTDEEGDEPITTESDEPQEVSGPIIAVGPGVEERSRRYLFILDQSGSMGNIIERLRLGFESLGSAEFPTNSKVGVITTLIAEDPKAAELRLASQIAKFPSIRLEPGFLDLVNAAQIARYVTSSVTTETEKSMFQIPGCATGWFEPRATNADGVSCIRAHTQIAGSLSYFEPGLTAFRQYVTRHGESAFEKADDVSVIFVSDTEQPGQARTFKLKEEYIASIGPLTGVDSPELWGRAGEFELSELQNLFRTQTAATEKQNLVFHAIVKVEPNKDGEECGEEWNDEWKRNWYADLAKKSQGTVTDLCNSVDFSAPLKKIFTNEPSIQKVFSLDKALLSQGALIKKVLVDDVETLDFEVLESEQILVPWLKADRNYNVQVVYEVPSQKAAPN